MPKKNKGNRPVERKLPPLPAAPVGQRFLHYFNHPWNFIFAPVPEPGKKPAWLTESTYPLEPRNLWQQYLNPDTLLGVRFGSITRYLMLDVDKGSQYHPANDPIAYRSLLACLESSGLVRPVAITSSSSDGIHIYYFFPKPLPTFALAKCVWLALTDAEFKVRDGQLELYPNPKAYKKDSPSDYKAHRLPLQAGSNLLNDDLQMIGNDIGQFLDFAELSAAGQDLTTLESALTNAKSRQGGEYRPNASTRAEAWKQDLEQRISEGWTGRGQTNALLKDLACYGIVWQKLEGQALIDYVVATALAAPGYQQWCSHQHEIRHRASEWSQCCSGFYVKYCGNPNRRNSYKEQFGGIDNTENNIVAFRRSKPNAERHQQTIERIRSVVVHLEANGTLPAAATARSAAIIATSKELHGIGVSQTTLHKPDYLPLWHPKHYSPSGVIATLEPTSAVSTELEIEQISDPWLASKLLETLSLKETKENYTLPPLMKVLYLPAVSAAPPAPDDAPDSEPGLNWSNLSQTKTHNNSQSELSSGAVNCDHKQTLSLRTITETRIETTDFIQIAKLRVQAVAHAQKTVKWASLSAGRVMPAPERARFEQIARMQFYWRSGEPSLMSEAREWALAHPGALPEALQTADFSLGDLSDPLGEKTTTPNLTEKAPHQSPTTASTETDGTSAAAELEPSTMPSPAKFQRQGSNRRLQPVEILTDAGEWVSGYFVHSGIVVANLAGLEQRFQLFDAPGDAYTFFGQIRLRG